MKQRPAQGQRPGIPIVEAIDQITEKKVMQDDHARMPCQHGRHALVQGRIADRVHDPVEAGGMLVEPGSRVDREALIRAGRRAGRWQDQVELVMLRQRGEQCLGAGSRRGVGGRQGRHIGQRQPRRWQRRGRAPGYYLFDRCPGRFSGFLRRLADGRHGCTRRNRTQSACHRFAGGKQQVGLRQAGRSVPGKDLPGDAKRAQERLRHGGNGAYGVGRTIDQPGCEHEIGAQGGKKLVADARDHALDLRAAVGGRGVVDDDLLGRQQAGEGGAQAWQQYGEALAEGNPEPVLPRTAGHLLRQVEGGAAAGAVGLLASLEIDDDTHGWLASRCGLARARQVEQGLARRFRHVGEVGGQGAGPVGRKVGDRDRALRLRPFRQPP